MSEFSGNACLAGDITVEIGSAFSEAMIVAFEACDDQMDALSMLQKKEVLGACMTVFIDMRERVLRILELDLIARECVGDTNKLRDFFEDIGVNMNIEDDRVGFDD